MGRKSQERHTGLTYEERIVAHRPCLNNTVDILKEQKRINKLRLFVKGLLKTMRIGRVGV